MTAVDSRHLSGKLRAAVLVDDCRIAEWQYEALLQAVEDTATVSTVLICGNSHTKRSFSKAAYYTLSSTLMRSTRGPRRDLRDLTDGQTTYIHFDSDWVGDWQRLPDDIQEMLRGQRIDVVIKFGMGLMKDADWVPARLGVVSYHHGDPSRHRGRPASFYEVLAGERVQGVMVQRISSRLDSGEVLAYGDFWIQPDSLRRSCIHVYTASAPLLRLALRNAARGETVARPTDGINHRLPNTRQVLSLMSRTTIRKVRRLSYGLTMQKRWRIAFSHNVESLDAASELSPREVLAAPVGSAFLADPHVIDEKYLLCEALPANSGSGEILLVTAGVPKPVLGLPESHLSYPSVVTHDRQTWLLPEMQESGAQQIFPLDLDGARVGPGRRLVGLEDRRLVDPTLWHDDGTWWLFAGERGTAQDCLSLFYSDGIFGPYRPHPLNPIVIDPARARMAGPIIRQGAHAYRPGQNSSQGYGAGLTLCRIDRISREAYLETPTGSLHILGAKGPHTIDVAGSRSTFDYYTEEFTLLAGWTRLRGLLSRRSDNRGTK